MNNNLLPISVIIPNYNSSNYLIECIESINANKWPAEILIIDDCSTDESFNIALKLQSTFSNIRVIKNEINSGAAEARKLGIFSATQKYISLVDADDFIEASALTEAYFMLLSSEADICLFDLWSFDEIKTWRHGANSNNLPMTGREAVLLTLGGWNIHAAGLSLKSLYELAYQEFTEKAFNADELLTRLVFSNAGQVVGCKKKYFYRSHSESTTRKLNVRRLSSLNSHLWLIKFTNEFPEAPIRKIVCGGIGDAWFLWRHRKQIGNAETLRALQIFLPKISSTPKLWSWLWYYPKYFIALLSLLFFIWLDKQVNKTKINANYL